MFNGWSTGFSDPAFNSNCAARVGTRTEKAPNATVDPRINLLRAVMEPPSRMSLVAFLPGRNRRSHTLLVRLAAYPSTTLGMTRGLGRCVDGRVDRPMSTVAKTKSAAVRERLTHPVVDGDGHMV